MTKKDQETNSQQSEASHINDENTGDVSGKSKIVVARANIIVAIITLVVALIGLIKVLPWENWFPIIPTPTAAVTVTATATFTSYPTATPTNTATSTIFPTLVNTASASPPPEPETDEMYARLEANLLEGKAPLRVNLDARASFVQFTDGSVAECGNSHFCSFTFTIIPDSRSAETFQKNEGRLSYTFSRKGEYIVAVYVCRGNACDDDSVAISIR